MGLRLATDNGEKTDPVGIIKDCIIQSLVIELGETFEATSHQWAEGIYEAMSAIGEAQSDVAMEEMKHKLKELLECK